LLKLEREKGAKMLIEQMKMIANTGFCPTEWKNARTILLYKDGDRENPGKLETNNSYKCDI
jgi:hypothetical protein